MELREIKTFLEIARQGSFCKASEKLGYTQAAVTIQIKQLESELGVLLFDRLGKKTTLTHQGEFFYKYAIKMIKYADEAKFLLSEQNELSGKLVIGTIDSVCSTILPNLIELFHTQFPKVSIKIVVDTPKTLIKMMNDNVIDFIYFLDERIFNSKWIKAFEKEENVVFVSSNKSLLHKKETVNLDDVLENPLILTEKGASYRQSLEQFLASKGKKVRPIIETGNTEFIINMLNRNMGISFLPQFMIADEINSGKLFALPIKDFSLQVWQQIIYHKDKWLSREMQEFFNIVQQQMN